MVQYSLRRFGEARAFIDIQYKWHKKQKHTSLSLINEDLDVCLFGGSDENRTRVQRPIHTTFSVVSQSIKFPTSERRLTGSRQGSFFMRDRYKSNSRFTCTTDLTHGESRSPLSRYGRHIKPRHCR